MKRPCLNCGKPTRHKRRLGGWLCSSACWNYYMQANDTNHPRHEKLEEDYPEMDVICD